MEKNFFLKNISIKYPKIEKAFENQVDTLRKNNWKNNRKNKKSDYTERSGKNFFPKI